MKKFLKFLLGLVFATLLLLIPSLSWGMRMVSPLSYSLEISDNFIYLDKNLINEGQIFETIPTDFYLNPFINELVNQIRSSNDEKDYFLYFDKASKRDPSSKKNLLITITKTTESLNWENNVNEYELNKSFKLNKNNYLSVNFKTQSENFKKYESAIKSFEEIFITLEEATYYPKVNFNIFGDPAALAKNKEIYEAYKKAKDDAFQQRLIEANETYGTNMTKTKNNFKYVSIYEEYAAQVFYGNECTAGRSKYVSTNSLNPREYDAYMDMYSKMVYDGKEATCTWVSNILKR